MDVRLGELRREVGRGPAGRRGFGPELRRRVVEWAGPRLAEGEPVRAVAQRVGISHETLRRWMQHGVSTFRRVRVTPAPADAPSGRAVVVRLPSGVAVEGLGMDEVIAVLRALA